MLASRWMALFLSAICGALSVFAFAPFGVWVLAPLCVAGLFYLVVDASPRTAFCCGLAYGYGLFGFGTSWVYVSLSTYGGMPFWMGAIAVLGFAGLLALFIALPCYLVTRFVRHSSKTRLLALPLLWVVFEWLQGWVLTGFPWMDLGYTQTSTWLFGWASVGGVYLVSGMVTILAACITWLWIYKSWQPIAALAAVFAVSWVVNGMSWSESTGDSIRVGVVQANVPINSKWQLNRRQQLISDYQRLSEELQNAGTLDLIIWPETALPLNVQEAAPEFWRAITPSGSALLTGVMDTPSLLAPKPSYDESYNAAVLSCDGATQVYRKRHLVPFGEYLPMRFMFGWVLDYLELPMSDFSYWKGGPQSLTCGDKINVGLSICYEDAFANEHRAHSGDATMLVNISEDAWFGDSLAPHQRLQMAQMRARELSRPLVRSANSGPSVMIDHLGRVLAKTPQFEVHTLAYELAPQTGATPYKRFGDWYAYLCLVMTLAMVFLGRKVSET